ncbi:MAG: hypothetical protein WCK28_19885 [Burkholderiales bacterium]|jgi:predicted small lipoprotein YifL
MKRTSSRTSVRLVAAAALVAVLAGCGHDGYYGPPPTPVAGLGLQLTRTAPEVVQLDWSYDPAAFSYDVTRDGYPLATVTSGTTLVDASVYSGYRYCYQVTGRSPGGRVVSVSSSGCITVF